MDDENTEAGREGLCAACGQRYNHATGLECSCYSRSTSMQDSGLGIFEGMYDEPSPEPTKPEWVVRVGRAEDAEGYRYIANGDTYSITKDASLAHTFPNEKEAWAEALQYTHGHAFNRTGVVKEEPGYLNVILSATMEGQLFVEVRCDDFDHYKRLPAAVSYTGQLLGKTGWNSDTHRAYYKSGVPLAKEVR